MNGNAKMDPMLQIFVSETFQQIEELEQAVLNIEKSTETCDAINEIFRLMHSIKGSSAMMLYNNISTLAHSIEDLFAFIRKNPEGEYDYPEITDIVLDSVDFIKNEVIKIQNQAESNGDSSSRSAYIKEYLNLIKNKSPNAKTLINEEPKIQEEKQKYYISSAKSTQDESAQAKSEDVGSSEVESILNAYQAVIFFEEDCGMENVRAFVVIHELQDIGEVIKHEPADIEESDTCVDIIKEQGFKVWFKSSKEKERIREQITNTGYIKEINLNITDDISEKVDEKKPKRVIVLDDIEELNQVDKSQFDEILQEIEHIEEIKNAGILKDDKTVKKELQSKEMPVVEKPQLKEMPLVEKQESISVNILKLDKLMDLVGELVISEAMVTRNPDLDGLALESFNKAARQLQKITNDIQDVVTSIRMVPLALTFQKMNRLVRDMSRQLKKEIELEILGETTEVDKNIIEHLSDPLMHIIRNSLDHGIGTPEERINKGKPPKGKITLEGRNAGGEVWILVRDDGKGLDKNKILAKAKENKLLTKPESELSDKEIFSFIFHPGLSTKENVSEFSGRGVGMDVVMKNIEKIRGTVNIDSVPEQGTVISIKIPLTLAIINGMTVKVGESTYTVPTVSIKESFRIRDDELIIDPDGNEMLLVRGKCYPIVRLNQLYKVATEIQKIDEGIIMMIENENKSVCLFADSLIGEQQVVVKALPKYVKKVKGIAGCTLLGDGSISLILDAGELIN